MKRLHRVALGPAGPAAGITAGSTVVGLRVGIDAMGYSWAWYTVLEGMMRKRARRRAREGELVCANHVFGGRTFIGLGREETIIAGSDDATGS